MGAMQDHRERDVKALATSRWNEEYRSGRYAGELPLPFVSEILNTLRAHSSVRRGTGLYVGCGNGRNYLPLVDAGLDLIGLDLSSEAIGQLAERRPALEAWRLICADFRTFQSNEQRFDYLIAIQVFQHGDEADVATYFNKVAALLGPGRLLFLRVNSATTQIHHRHTVVERNAFGGITVRYEEGPKRGLLIHFYSEAELTERLKVAFVPVMEPQEDIKVRTAPKTGYWAQWEGIWKRRDHDRTNA